MPTTQVVNTLVFLDDMNEFNGPLFLIPGSHKEGMIDVTLNSRDTNKQRKFDGNFRWMSGFSAKLKYALDQKIIANLIAKYGIYSIKAAAGSVLFFNGNIVHASPNNISPFNRAIVIVTYNSIENIPMPVENPRPEFLVSRDYRPVEPLSESALLIESLT